MPFDSARQRNFRSAVLKWYDKFGRRLPWRTSADPYRIWLSEIMLQQTTVVTVVPYFERFVARFPDVESLAAADVDDVMRLWEGLGYYSRARNLHKAALMIQQRHAGEFPRDVDSLLALPGIGRYTAGAIASFAFDQPAPVVEANTERLYARLTGLADDVKTTASQRSLWEFAARIVPRRRPGDFNQALMDIGSQICRPQEPACGQCPLSVYCEAFRLGRQDELPVRRQRTPVTAVEEVCIAIRRGNKFLLRRRTENERWAGMWDFLRFEIDAAELKQLPSVPGGSRKQNKKPNTRSLFAVGNEPLTQTLQQRIFDLAGAKVGDVIAMTQFNYSVTRYRVRLTSFLCNGTAAARPKVGGTQWFAASELASLPLSKTGRLVANWLTSAGAQPHPR